MKRKILAIFLCVALCLVAAVPAWATGSAEKEVTSVSLTTNPGNGNLVITGNGTPVATFGVMVKDANGLVLYIGEVQTTPDGTFRTEFYPNTDFAMGAVTAIVGGETATLSEYIDPTKSDAKELKSFSIYGVSSTISGSRVTLNLSKGYKLVDLVPVFTVSPGATVYVGDAMQTSGHSSVDFTAPVTYVVRAADRSEKSYTVTVTANGDENPSDIGTGGGGGSLGGGGGNAEAGEEIIFTDLGSTPWATDAIYALAKAGVVNGVGNQKFDPNGLVTREQFAKMLVLACGFKADAATCDFYDVVTGSWYYRYVAEAYRQGIMKGVDQENMGIGRNITRQDLCTMVYRAVIDAKGLSLPKTVQRTTFADETSIASYASDAVHALQEAGIINGMGYNTFAPTGSATRAQAAKIIYGIYELVQAK